MSTPHGATSNRVTLQAIRSPLIWAVGDLATYAGLLSGHGITESNDKYNVVLALPGANDTLYHEMARQHRLLCPVIDATPEGNLLRADARLETINTVTLDAALDSLQPVRERLAKLSPIEQLADRHSLMVLALAWSRDRDIEATWRFEARELLHYPLLTGLPDQRALLEELATAELLTRRFLDRVYVCGGCRGSRMNVREECPDCRSSHLVENDLVHHYYCAHQAPEPDFASGRLLICPKCRRELRHYGVDYDKPGTIFLCRRCGKHFTDPLVGFVCADCGNHNPGEHADTIDWYHYSITPQGISAVLSGILPHLSLEDTLSGYPGAYSRRDFIILLHFQQSIVGRYGRPLTVLGVRMDNVGALEQDYGGRDVGRAFALLVEVVAQSLRQSDAVTARHNTLYLLLPETSVEHERLITERIRTQAKNTLSIPLQLRIRRYPSDELDTLIGQLTQ